MLAECRDVLNRDTVLWPGDWLAAEVASRYGDAIWRQGPAHYEAARQILESAAADIAKARGAPDWSLPAARHRVADLYEAWGKSAEAARWR